MKQDNGHKTSTGVIDDDRTLDESLIIENERQEPEGAATGQKQKRSKGKKAGMIAIALVLLTGSVGALFLFGFSSDNRVVEVEPPARAQAPAATAPGAEQAITSLGQQMRSNAPVVQATPADGTLTPYGATQPGANTLPQAPVTGAPPDLSNMPVSSTYPGMEAAPTNGVAGTVPGTAGAPATASPSASRAPSSRVTPLSEIESSPAKQTSTYFFATPFVKAGAETVGAPLGAETTLPATRPAKSAPVVPPFGAQLPVRSLGAIYSLRREGYVRLETTRAVKGEGWSLPRGTQLVGRTSGTQDNRIFVQLLGYISTDGKLVKVGGEVNGVDGGAGLRGERKNMGKRWVKALSEIGSGGLQVLNSWLGGRNGGTQIYMPAASGSLGDLQSQYGLQNNSREYVAVKAGTLGSVMITDLAESINGVQPDLNESAPSGAPPMSEDEIVELLTNGTPEQIRAALPRMPRQVRPLAEAALREN